MQSRSTLWQQLAADGSFTEEVRAVIGGTSYTAITAPKISGGLCDKPLSVGGCGARSALLDVQTDDTPGKAASVVIQARLVDDAQQTDWMDLGHFYVKVRTRTDDMLHLECYDALLKADQAYLDAVDGAAAYVWPRPMADVVTDIAGALGVDIDSRTSINTGTDYEIDNPGTLTMRQILGHIGAVHGGNWCVTAAGQLRLVPIKPDASAEALDVPIVTDKITTGRPLTITRVTLSKGAKADGYTYGTDTGAELLVEACPYASDTAAQALYTALNGYVYQPYQLDGATYDPCAELGDALTAGEAVSGVLLTQDATYSNTMTASISAPDTDEVADEFPYITPTGRLSAQARELEKQIEALDERNLETEARLDAVRSLNEVIAGALGLHTTAIRQDDGSSVLYYHSNPYLERSADGDVIYTFNAGGFAWCATGWNNGAPDWQYGITRDGNAVVNLISAGGISVEKPGLSYSTAITPEGFQLMYNGLTLFDAASDLCRIRNVEVSQYIKVGAIRIVPYPQRGSTPTGADIYFEA